MQHLSFRLQYSPPGHRQAGGLGRKGTRSAQGAKRARFSLTSGQDQNNDEPNHQEDTGNEGDPAAPAPALDLMVQVSKVILLASASASAQQWRPLILPRLRGVGHALGETTRAGVGLVYSSKGLDRIYLHAVDEPTVHSVTQRRLRVMMLLMLVEQAVVGQVKCTYSYR